MNKFLAIAVALVAASSLAIVLSSCGEDDSSAPKAPAEKTDSNPYTNPIKAEGSSPARLAGDGRYFGYVRSVDAGSRTIDFDVAQFFFGKSVQQAAERDGVVQPGEPVSNDHYERDATPGTKELKVASDVEVTGSIASRLYVARCTSDCAPPTPVTLTDFFGSFDTDRDRGSAAGAPFWLTIEDGLVVRIDEQYFP